MHSRRSAPSSPSCAPRKPSLIHRSEPRAMLHDGALEHARALLDRIAAALAPLESVATAGEQDFAALAARHRDAVVQMSLDGDGMPAAFAGADGTALEAAFSDIAENVRAFHGGAGRLCRAARPRHRRPRRAPARRAGQPHPHLRSARSAPHRRRPRRRRRPGRGRVAARSAHRSLAQPADAPRARARPAGTAHRPVRP